MDKSLLQTKIYIPPTQPDHINRPRIISKLDEGLIKPRALTLISAPAGYGKPSILVERVQKRQRPMAWFSIDKFDNEPGRFFSYLFSAVQTVFDSLGEELNKQLQVAKLPSPLSLMTALINEFTSLASDRLYEPGH